jgi:hypothetical protein
LVAETARKADMLLADHVDRLEGRVLDMFERVADVLDLHAAELAKLKEIVTK